PRSCGTRSGTAAGTERPGDARGCETLGDTPVGRHQAASVAVVRRQNRTPAQYPPAPLRGKLLPVTRATTVAHPWRHEEQKDMQANVQANVKAKATGAEKSTAYDVIVIGAG